MKKEHINTMTNAAQDLMQRMARKKKVLLMLPLLLQDQYLDHLATQRRL